MLSKLFEESSGSRKAIFIAVGIGATTLLGYAAYRCVKKHLDSLPPKQWRRVGEVTDLNIYPIKSCGSIRVKQIDCSLIGPRIQLLRDRIFMVIQSDGSFITGRTYPTLVLVQPRFDEKYETMTLSAPGMLDISIDVQRLFALEPVKASVWGQTVPAVDCGEEVARWLSRFLLSEDFGLRLVFYPYEYSSREVREKNKIFVNLTKTDSGALHDSTSFMLLTEASIADVNSRLEKPVTAVQYRPNIVVKGPAAYEEDNWKWIKIGETIYRNIKPCTSTNSEPLKTLKKYRRRSYLGDNPVLGMQMGVKKQGIVRVGEPVFVGC
ncbi:mitochondrial amidoxime reducing component 2-like isoform X2 [Malaya genurostris]|uniref:mitochondrial amidoxime reducing component 2-like isoform X2 n=1 Tax=Malaya genurostris TaxID=325434 RepID=UPI0026F386C8|nr:mitochondrial amidoxime reducing component 2-like isoform X2 [Malaya genurostris]